MRQPAQGNSKKKKEGFSFTFYFVTFCILGALLGYNYTLNVDAEKNSQQGRRYGSYKDEDLALLIAGYDAELKELEAREKQLKKAAESAPHNYQMLGDNVKEFDRVSQQSREQRDVSAKIGETQIFLRDLQSEKKLREQNAAAAGWMLHARRLLSFGELLKKI